MTDFSVANMVTPTRTLPSLSVEALAGPQSRQRKESIIRGLFFAAALVSVLISVLIVVSLVREAWTFITQVDWAVTWGETGWFPRRGLYDMPTLLVSSIIVTVVAMLVAGPLGLGAAIYLSEYASRRVRGILKPVLEVLAGVPSVVLGFFALFFISPQVIEKIGRSAWLWIGYSISGMAAVGVGVWALRAWRDADTTTATIIKRVITLAVLITLVFVLFWWVNSVAQDCSPVAGDTAACPAENSFAVKRSGQLAAAAIGVGILTIPLVASVAEDALASVPRELREASAGLGARKATTTRQVVLPAAVSGIVAAFIIGISRALGETMVVFMAGGAADAAEFTSSPFEGGLTMTAGMASLATGTDSVVGEGLTFQSLYFVGLVLFVITLLLNVVAGRFVARVRERY
jgi:ABC-type phosphate transport system permease subunit